LVSALILAIAVAINSFHNGIKCGNAMLATGDFFPLQDIKFASAVTDIYAVSDRQGSDVAWIFVGNTGDEMIEATRQMSFTDGKLAELPSNPAGWPATIYPYKGTVWPDLTQRLCANGGSAIGNAPIRN
jgi:hypothetical protein